VNDPQKRRLFKQFVNTDETEPTIEFVHQRDQHRPADWTNDFVPVGNLTLRESPPVGNAPLAPDEWVLVGKVWDFPANAGAAVKHGQTQIAVFNFASRNEWYATQNMCPHRREFVLSRGMVGDQGGKPKVACPVHKKTFALESGQCLSGDNYSLRTFPVKRDGDDVYLYLPPAEELDKELATAKTCNGSCDDSTPRPVPLPKRKAKVMGPFAVGPLGESY
jgi:nitrite reductase (NADH) large subunit